MTLYPGMRTQRIARRSRLAFMWDARDCSLLARSGQQGAFSANIAGTVGGSISPAVGPSNVLAGKAQPRFGRLGTLNLLDLSGVTAGQDIETLTYPYAMGPSAFTVVLKLTPSWAAGASRATAHFVFGLGSSLLGSTYFRISRGGSSATSWTVTRSVVGAVTTNNVVEPNTYVWPLDVRAFYDLGGSGWTRIQLRDATGAMTTEAGTGTTADQLLRWSGEILGLGSDPGLGLGAPIRLHSCKLALGLKTFADMDLIE